MKLGTTNQPYFLPAYRPNYYLTSHPFSYENLPYHSAAAIFCHYWPPRTAGSGSTLPTVLRDYARASGAVVLHLSGLVLTTLRHSSAPRRG
jgi:hypothetical protein